MTDPSLQMMATAEHPVNTTEYVCCGNQAASMQNKPLRNSRTGGPRSCPLGPGNLQIHSRGYHRDCWIQWLKSLINMEPASCTVRT